jgi:uncharacterized BrkB/YihY/UPF0761 family membrane protein
MYSDTGIAEASVAGITGLFGMLFCCLYFMILALGLVLFILWIWMLIDVIQRNDKDFGPTSTKDTKLIWLLVILLTQGVGAAAYYFMIYRKFPRVGEEKS